MRASSSGPLPRIGIPAACAALFAAAWAWAAWRPLFPQDWALENVLSLAAAWWLLRRHRRQPLTDTSYMLLCAFGIAHVVGSHYTYAEVPYDRAWQAVAGYSLNEALGFERNHYDRLVHFLFGFLCYRPLRDLGARLPEPAVSVAPVLWVATIALAYEQVEMVAALAFGGELGQAYLGTQGDPWDAQKDSALALAGALLALGISAAGRMTLTQVNVGWPD